MSKPEFFNKQEAINPNKSAWVSASAGTGKTTILVDRIIRLLLNGVPINKILCITYTKVGAKEMVERLLVQLSEYSVLKDQLLSEKLLGLLGRQAFDKEFNRARSLFNEVIKDYSDIKIKTIHAFCQDLLARFPIEAEVPIGFTTIMKKEDSKLKDYALEEVLKNYLEFNPHTYLYNNKDHLIYILNYFSKKTFQSIINEALEGTNYLDEMYRAIYFEKNNTAKEKNLAERDFKSEIFYSYNAPMQFINPQSTKSNASSIDEYKQMVSEFIIQNLPFYIKLNSEYKILSEPRKSKLQEELIDYQVKCNYGKEPYKLASSADNILNSITNLFFTNHKPRASVSQLVDKMSDTDYEAFSAQYNKLFGNNISKDSNTPEGLIVALNNLISAQVNYAFNILILEVYTKYKALKLANGYLNYTDLLAKTKNLLAEQTVPWVMYKLDSSIDHILLDESQDTSQIQWEIINMLSHDFVSGISADYQKTLFVVGDIKQSIFAFQGADPNNFFQQRTNFEQKFANANNKLYLLNSNQSYRSSQSIIQVINSLCEQIFNKNLPYYQSENFTHLTNINTLADNFSFMPTIGLNEESKNKVAKKVYFNAAKVVVEKIKELNNVLHIEYKDIAIIYRKRKTNELINPLILLCKQNGIPVALDKIDLGKEIFIKDIVSLIKFVLQPNDDFSLAALLKSPMFNLDDNKILEIKLASNNSIFNNIKALSIYASLFRSLNLLIKLSKESSIYEFLFNIFYIQKHISNFIARLSLQVEEIANELLSMILEFESKNLSNFQFFLQYLEQYDQLLESDNSSSNYINLLTVHGSKGMQFKAVIVIEFLRARLYVNNLYKTTTNITTNTATTTKKPMFAISLSKQYNSDFIKDIKKDYTASAKEEENRLLYVALTRAKNYIYFYPVSNNPSVKKTDDNNETPYPQDSWSYNIFKALNDSNNTYQVNEKITQNELFLKQEPYNIERFVANSTVQPTPVNVIPEIVLNGQYDWVFTKPTTNPLASISLENKIIPSKLKAHLNQSDSRITNSNLMQKGSILHKILDHTDHTVGYDNKIEYAKTLLNSLELDDESVEEIFENVKNILQHPVFKEISGKQHKIINEANISGILILDGEQKLVSARIDKLILSDVITIIDYKFAKHPNTNTDSYVKQVRLYKKLIEALYPNQEVKGFILFSKNGKIIEV